MVNAKEGALKQQLRAIPLDVALRRGGACAEEPRFVVNARQTMRSEIRSKKAKMWVEVLEDVLEELRGPEGLDSDTYPTRFRRLIALCIYAEFPYGY